MEFCHCLSLTRNSIYSIHSSYYSIDLASCIGNILIISWLILWPAFSNALVQIQQCSSLIDIATTAWSLCVNLGFIVVLLIWLTALNWMNDLWMESFLALTGTEQFSLIYGIKWLIVSECMLFFACFWSLINFRVISTGFSLFFSFPLFFTYSFGIPFSNLLILLFSGVPIQAAQIFLKIGFLINTIEGLGQCLCCGWLFIILQLKEFLYSYFSLSDVMIGSIFYFTTGLHGFHVLFGSFGFFLTLWLIIFSVNDYSLTSINASLFFCNSIRFVSNSNTRAFFLSKYFVRLSTAESMNLNVNFIRKTFADLFLFPVLLKELSMSLFLVSFYWHFVDWIWFLVFLFFILSFLYMESNQSLSLISKSILYSIFYFIFFFLLL